MNEYVEQLKKVLKERVLICIDAANLEQSVKTMWVNPKDTPDILKAYTADKLRWFVDYLSLKLFFSELAEVSNIRIYTPAFESISHNKFLYFLDKKVKCKLITKPLKQYHDHTEEHPHRKANFDVELSADSVYLMDQYETLIIFSGDCDFEYLLKFLRGKGKNVIGFSRSGHVAKEIPPACSYYFDIADFRKQFSRVAHAKNPGSN